MGVGLVAPVVLADSTPPPVASPSPSPTPCYGPVPSNFVGPLAPVPCVTPAPSSTPSAHVISGTCTWNSTSECDVTAGYTFAAGLTYQVTVSFSDTCSVSACDLWGITYAFNPGGGTGGGAGVANNGTGTWTFTQGGSPYTGTSVHLTGRCSNGGACWWGSGGSFALTVDQVGGPTPTPAPSGAVGFGSRDSVCGYGYRGSGTVGGSAATTCLWTADAANDPRIGGSTCTYSGSFFYGNDIYTGGRLRCPSTHSSWGYGVDVTSSGVNQVGGSVYTSGGVVPVVSGTGTARLQAAVCYDASSGTAAGSLSLALGLYRQGSRVGLQTGQRSVYQSGGGTFCAWYWSDFPLSADIDAFSWSVVGMAVGTGGPVLVAEVELLQIASAPGVTPPPAYGGGNSVGGGGGGGSIDGYGPTPPCPQVGPLSGQPKWMVCQSALLVCTQPSTGFDAPGWLGWIACWLTNDAPVVGTNALISVLNYGIDLVEPGAALGWQWEQFYQVESTRAPFSWIAAAQTVIEGSVSTSGQTDAGLPSTFTVFGVTVTIPWSWAASTAAPYRSWLAPLPYLALAYFVLRQAVSFFGSRDNQQLTLWGL